MKFLKIKMRLKALNQLICKPLQKMTKLMRTKIVVKKIIKKQKKIMQMIRRMKKIFLLRLKKSKSPVI